MKKNIISAIKDSYAGIFVSLCLSFMLLFYEPINIFANNLMDFWFDIYAFFPVVLFQTLLAFLILSLFFIIIRKINKNVYYFFVVCFLIGTICTYIQGNFLSGSLPGIDGTWVNFDTFKTEKIISIVLWLVVTAAIIFVLVKYKMTMIEKVSKYSSLVIIAMLFTSMISFITISGFFDHKDATFSTNTNINNMSSDKNFVIILFDAAGSEEFNSELEKLGKKESVLENFTYYPDTEGGYPFTKNSIPLILTGKWYENEGNFTDFYTEAFDSSPLFKKLEDEKYTINLYETDINNYVGENYTRFASTDKNKGFDLIGLFKEEAKLILYKYLPYQLKWRAKASSFNIANARNNPNDYLYSRNNKKNYLRIKNEDFEITKENNFQFLHLEGAHVPFQYDVNFNEVNNGTYEQSVDSCITYLEAYINKLKENNLYDNTVIVVIADHGYYGGTQGRQNPILYIKGINEKHPYQVSDKKVSFDDLMDAFSQLIDGDTSDKLFANIDNSKRRYITYEQWDKEDEYIEYYQTGHAWETETLEPTGKKYLVSE